MDKYSDGHIKLIGDPDSSKVPLSSRFAQTQYKVFTAADSHLPVRLKNLKEVNKVVPSSLILKDRCKTSQKMKRHQSQPSIAEKPTNLQLLPVMKKNLETNKLTISKGQAPYLGLKYHLGHTAYLPKELAKNQKNK